jgi:hypothetical protein
VKARNFLSAKIFFKIKSHSQVTVLVTEASSAKMVLHKKINSTDMLKPSALALSISLWSRPPSLLSSHIRKASRPR